MARFVVLYLNIWIEKMIWWKLSNEFVTDKWQSTAHDDNVK